MNILWWLFAAIWLVCAAYVDNYGLSSLTSRYT